ncbi:hypothetical protein LTR95_014889, partial [Oleoguttula sp. CCFEE 5521]
KRKAGGQAMGADDWRGICAEYRRRLLRQGSTLAEIRRCRKHISDDAYWEKEAVVLRNASRADRQDVPAPRRDGIRKKSERARKKRQPHSSPAKYKATRHA